ncbi:MAG: NUDIX domain-containing protein [Halobacteriovoraceae bacterium]|nr:NUDIX domain-containing protein [Halobacteriovoraceae bacterium]
MKKKVQVVVLGRNNSSSADLEVLVFKTNKERGSFWQNVTGSVEPHESFYEAAVRELVEETGIDKSVAEKKINQIETEFFFTDRKDRHVQEKVYFYLGPKFDVQMSDEHVDYKWLPVRKVQSNGYRYESNYQALLKAIEKLSTTGV